MSPKVRAALGAVLAIGLTFAVWVAPAAARTTGKASFRGQIIAPSESGKRHIVSSIVVAKGVFTGVGKIVEVANRPGDPANVTRHDLVFRGGTMHVRHVSQAPEFSLDPQTCVVTARVKATGEVEGGTRRFRHASGTIASTVRAWGVAARNPDGTCNAQADLLLDAAELSSRGTLSF